MDMNNFNFTTKDVLDTLKIVDEFLLTTRQLQIAKRNQCNGLYPNTGSIAAKELQNFKKIESVQNVYKSSFLKMDCAADHLMLMIKGFTPPVMTLAPWVNVRSILELCAHVSWVLDLEINIETRVNRIFAIRYDELKQQKVISEIRNNRSRPDEKQTDAIKKRMKIVLDDGLTLGCPEIKNHKGITVSIGERMPLITDLVKVTLDREFEYRMTSAIAHGDIWATTQMGYQQNKKIASNEKGITPIEKHITPEAIFYAFHISISAFSQCFWYWWKLYGWDENEITSLLDNTFDKLKYSNSHRPWKNEYLQLQQSSHLS